MRVTELDTILEVVKKLAEGNPGAMTTLAICIKEDEGQARVGMLLLDSLEIYGSAIYVLFNDKCDRNAAKFLLLLKATYQGCFSPDQLQDLAADQMYKVNLPLSIWEQLAEAVQE